MSWAILLDKTITPKFKATTFKVEKTFSFHTKHDIFGVFSDVLELSVEKLLP